MELPAASQSRRTNTFGNSATHAPLAAGLLRPPENDGCKVHDGQFGFEVSEKNDRRGRRGPMTTTTTTTPTTTTSSSATAESQAQAGAAAGVPAVQRGGRARGRGADACPRGCAAQCRPVHPLRGAARRRRRGGAIPRATCPALAQWLRARARSASCRSRPCRSTTPSRTSRSRRVLAPCRGSALVCALRTKLAVPKLAQATMPREEGAERTEPSEHSRRRRHGRVLAQRRRGGHHGARALHGRRTARQL